MTLRRLLRSTLLIVPLACGDPAPPPRPADAGATPNPRAAPAQEQRITPLPHVDTLPSTTFGPFTIDGHTYVATAARFRSLTEGDSVTGTSRVDIRDSLQRVVYSTRVMSDKDIADGSWNDFSVTPLEDASGRVRALMLSTSWYPSAPATGESFSVVAPRGDSLPRLFTVDWFGNDVTTAAATSHDGTRLLAGDQIMLPRWMYFYEAKVAVHVSLDCAPASHTCLQVALPDSIAGLARFAVDAGTRSATDSSAAVELLDAPLATHGTKVMVPKGVIVEVLGGAGKVSFEWDGEVQRVNVTDDWLLVRVAGHTGWISGDESYQAIGLHSAG